MSQTAGYAIGVDGGGTGCRAVLTDGAGAVLGRGTGGPANFTSAPETALANVRAAIGAAAAEAGVPPEAALQGAAHIGLAGVQTAADARAVEAAFPFARGCVATDDRPTFARGALAGRDGVLIAIGTGSFAAQVRGGRLDLLGGWGFQVGDQASGAWIGRALLTRALLAHDRLQASSALVDDVLAQFGGDPNAIVQFATKAAPAAFAEHAPAVAEAAARGDAVAVEIMVEGARYVSACLTRFAPEATDVVVLAGGLGPAYAPYVPDHVRAHLAPPLGTALDGALALALERLTR